MKATDPTANVELLQSAIENTSVTAFKQDPDLRYTWLFNPPANFAGHASIGKSDADFLPPGAQLKHIEGLKRRALAGESIKEISKYKDSYFMMHVNPDRTADDTIIGIEGIAVDVTELQRVKENLETLNRSLLKTMDNSLDLIGG